MPARLDGVLGSGYRQGQMVELVGESGSGKSQVFCFGGVVLGSRIWLNMHMRFAAAFLTACALLAQVCLLAAAANAAAGTPVLYIDTGNAFSTQRTASLFQTLPPLKRVRLPCEYIAVWTAEASCNCCSGVACIHTLSMPISCRRAMCSCPMCWRAFKCRRPLMHRRV